MIVSCLGKKLGKTGLVYTLNLPKNMGKSRVLFRSAQDKGFCPHHKSLIGNDLGTVFLSNGFVENHGKNGGLKGKVQGSILGFPSLYICHRR
jgi:hypothetical protein